MKVLKKSVPEISVYGATNGLNNVQGVKAESGKCLSSKFGSTNACTETNDTSAESP